MVTGSLGPQSTYSCTHLGDQHRKQRKMLNPVFSTTRMRAVLPIFQEVVQQVCLVTYSLSHVLTHSQLRDTMETEVANGAQELDMANLMSRTALELIGQGGLGYSFDQFARNAQNELAASLKHVLCVIILLVFLAISLGHTTHSSDRPLRDWRYLCYSSRTCALSYRPVCAEFSPEMRPSLLLGN